MNTYKIVKQKETKTAIVTLGNDDIVRVVFKSKATLTPEELESNYLAYNDIVGGEQYAFILTAENSTVDYTAEGRAYAKEYEHSWPKLCVALCVKSLAHKMVANFYLRFNRPSYSHKVFDSVETAENWCLDQIEKSKRGDLGFMPIFI